MDYSKKTIKELDKIVKANRANKDYKNIIAKLIQDPRKGVQNICKREIKRIDNIEQERLLSREMFEVEKELLGKGFKFIAGIDEAGRGPLAGPVAVASVILNEFDENVLYQDSKKLSESKREDLYDHIVKNSISYSIELISSELIDEINILNATLEAMKSSVLSLEETPDFVLVDGNIEIPGIKIKQRNYIGGDANIRVISAASILAKVYRDRLMLEYDKKYPLYKFAKHKGYGTQEHIDLIKKYGPCEIHRKSFLSNIL
jgi:ribonuclease HII